MALDASIYSNQLARPRSAQDYTQEYLQTAAAGQNMLAARLQMQDAQDQRAQQNALAQLMAGGFDRKAPDAVQRLYQTAPRLAPGVVKGFAEQDKAEADVAAKRTDTAQKKYSVVRDLIQGAHLAYQDALKQTNDPQQALQIANRAYQGGVQQLRGVGMFDDSDVQRAGTFDPQVAAGFLDRDKEMQQRNVTRGQDLTAETARRGQDMTDARTRSEGAANRAVTVRGQNLSDARAREANGVQRELLLQEKQLKVDALKDKATERQQAKDAAVASIENQIAVIDKALNHPGRGTATGLSGTIDPRNYIAGTDATDFRSVLDQIGGTAFLQAFATLKGAGQITEVEGKKATDAIARLSRAQSDAEFENSLKDLREVMAAGYKRQTGKDYPGTTGGSKPATRTVVRTGTLNGRKVVQYSDGTTDYAD